MKSKFVAAFLAITLLLSFFCLYETSNSPVHSMTMAGMVAYAASEPPIAQDAPIMVWYYKVENGYVYRRLFNTSTQQWETEWERC